MNETVTAHLESKDPWNGKAMRLPIGLIAKFEIKPDSVLAEGWKLYVNGLLNKQPRLNSLNS